jgi:poly(hydroxyalkanoate) granule-associated protein
MTRKTTNGKRMAVKETAQEIYLAGLGAVAVAGEEGSKLFVDLVKKGRALEKTGRAKVEDAVDQAMARARGIRAEAQGAVAKVASPLDEGMTNAMHKLGVPTRREIQTLTRRVEELTRVVEKRGQSAPRAAKQTAKRTRRVAK